MTTLNVNEIFYSLQGEGARAGSANVFIRLSGCKTKDACYASGVRCDTEFESGYEIEYIALASKVLDIAGYRSDKKGMPSIIWTGGEPAQQLTEKIVHDFKDIGFYQSIETSGLFAVPKSLDYVCVSPKVAEHVIAKNFKHVDELRYVRHAGQDIPQPSITASHYFISPHSDANAINETNLQHCIELVKQNPTWKLSVQLHKIWSIL